MRRRTARALWLLAGGVVLGLLAIGATNYVMRLDQEAEQVGGVPMDRVLGDGGRDAAAATVGQVSLKPVR